MCCCDNDFEVNKLVNRKKFFFNQQHNTKRENLTEIVGKQKKTFLSVKPGLIQYLCCIMQSLKLWTSIIDRKLCHEMIVNDFYDVNDISQGIVKYLNFTNATIITVNTFEKQFLLFNV